MILSHEQRSSLSRSSNSATTFQRRKPAKHSEHNSSGQVHQSAQITAHLRSLGPRPSVLATTLRAVVPALSEPRLAPGALPDPASKHRKSGAGETQDINLDKSPAGKIPEITKIGSGSGSRTHLNEFMRLISVLWSSFPR